MLSSCSRAARLLSVIGAISLAEDGFWRMAAVIALSFDLGMDMTTLVGSQANVSLTRSNLVYQTNNHREVEKIQHYLYFLSTE